MKKITDALIRTAITMGIFVLAGTAWFCIIRFLNPEWVLATISVKGSKDFMLCTILVFTLYYKK